MSLAGSEKAHSEAIAAPFLRRGCSQPSLGGIRSSLHLGRSPTVAPFVEDLLWL
jgi:hypothetical protein